MADGASLDVFEDKRVDQAALQSLFQKHPVVPELGDTSVALCVVLRRATNWALHESDHAKSITCVDCKGHMA